MAKQFNKRLDGIKADGGPGSGMKGHASLQSWEKKSPHGQLVDLEAEHKKALQKSKSLLPK